MKARSVKWTLKKINSFLFRLFSSMQDDDWTDESMHRLANDSLCATQCSIFFLSRSLSSETVRQARTSPSSNSKLYLSLSLSLRFTSNEKSNQRRNSSRQDKITRAFISKEREREEDEEKRTSLFSHFAKVSKRSKLIRRKKKKNKNQHSPRDCVDWDASEEEEKDESHFDNYWSPFRDPFLYWETSAMDVLWRTRLKRENRRLNPRLNTTSNCRDKEKARRIDVFTCFDHGIC